jgi:iron complex outermembrane receptor protein
VIDGQSNVPLAGATVAIKGHTLSTITDKDGYYSFPSINPGKIILVISYIGYETKEVPVTISEGHNNAAGAVLAFIYKTGDDVVVSASRRPEKITDAPASIQVIGKKELEQFTGSNVGELAAYVQGVEFVRMGVDNVSFNARGLNNAFNNKVFQMVDGRNSMSPLSGSLLMGNNVSVVKDDIERIEILLGPQTALYGPNVHNALFNYITKDPRKYPGTTLAVSVGNQSQFSARLRQAGKIGNKWAYKLTAEQALGRDFEFRDSVRGVGGGVYGPLDTVGERIDFDFKRIRGEAHVYYYLTSKATIIASAGGSKNTTINTQTAGHNRFVDMSNHFMQVRYTSPRFYATAYNAWADFGESYNVINYTREFWNRTHSRITDPADARFTTQGLLSAEEADAFAKQRARLRETPKRFNAEAQYNYSFVKQKMVVVAGLSYQNERPRGYGVNLVDSFQRIYITQYGAVLQVDKSLPWNLRFIGAARLDNHSNFGTYASPKLGLMKAVGNGNLRITWGRAVSMPSILYQYATTNNFFFGNGEGITYIPTNSKVTDTASFKTTRRLQPEEVKTWEIGYKGKLQKKLFIDVTLFNGVSRNFFTPSIQVNGRALRVGDKRVTHNPLFAGQVDGNGALRNARFSTIFNFGDVKVYGVDVGTNYQFNKSVNLALQYSWLGSNISKGLPQNDANSDGFVTDDEKSLNSPRHRGAVIISFQNLFKQKAFATVSARYVEQYDFYSGLQISTKAGEGRWGRFAKNFDWGPLGGFTTFDVRAGYQLNSQLSAGMNITNLFNAEQREFAGSPAIRRLIMFELKVQVPDKMNKQ